MKINFKKLFVKQAELDNEIALNHNVTYETTRQRRTLALLVELGELANATRCFKYWSHKPSEAMEVVMDEYADGLHFLISLGIDIGVTRYTYNQEETDMDLSDLFLVMYEKTSRFAKTRKFKDYKILFETYLQIAYKLNMSKKEIFDSYLLKLGENHHRQQTNY